MRIKKITRDSRDSRKETDRTFEEEVNDFLREYSIVDSTINGKLYEGKNGGSYEICSAIITYNQTDKKQYLSEDHYEAFYINTTKQEQIEFKEYKNRDWLIYSLIDYLRKEKEEDTNWVFITRRKGNPPVRESHSFYHDIRHEPFMLTSQYSVKVSIKSSHYAHSRIREFEDYIEFGRFLTTLPFDEEIAIRFVR